MLPFNHSLLECKNHLIELRNKFSEKNDDDDFENEKQFLSFRLLPNEIHIREGEKSLSE